MSALTVSGWLSGIACLPLTRWVVGLRPGRVTPKTIIKMIETASLHGTQCFRVEVGQCKPTV